MQNRYMLNRPHGGTESGIALVAVLWTTVLLSMLAAALVAMSRSDARLLSAERERLQASEAAEAGINLALVALSDGTGSWPMDGSPRTITFANTEIEVAVTSESGKIDLNSASRDLIRGLLTVAGEGPGEADKLADAIIERRTTQVASNRTTGGAESTTSGLLFNYLGELIQLPGMTRALFDRLEPNLTLYSGSPSVDPAFAPVDVLLAIPGNTQADVDAAIRARSSSARNQRSASGTSRVLGQAFSIIATVHLSTGGVARRNEVVRITGDPTRPVWVLSSK